MNEPHKMFQTQYALIVNINMNEFTEKHVAVCRRLFKTKAEAEQNGPEYIKELVSKAERLFIEGKSIFTLNEKGATFAAIEMDIEIG